MKKVLFLALVCLLSVGVANTTYAQKKSKEEKKKEKAEKKLWKQKVKKYKKDPLLLKQEQEATDAKVRQITEKNKELLNRYSSAQSRADSLEALLNEKSSKLNSLSAKYEKLQAAYEAQKNINEKGIIPGLVYKVQIGAFVHFDINHYLQTTKGENFEGETADGFNKYTVGAFRDLEVADAFKKDIRKMGIKDAWVVPYIDGQRVTMQEAKQYVAKQG